MTVTAQTVCRRVAVILNDTASVRWPLNELVRALNEAQLAVLNYRPDLCSKRATVTCIAGVVQSLPADGASLMRVERNNSATSKKVVRLAVVDHLDAMAPDWRSSTPADEIAHYMVDPREEHGFYVYPPATVAAALDIIYVARPTPIAEPALGTSLPADPATDSTVPTVVIGNVSVPDEVAFALVDYVIYRSLLKQGGTADIQRATAHYQAFAMALGIDLKGKISTGSTSNSRFNPGYPVMNTQPGIA